MRGFSALEGTQYEVCLHQLTECRDFISFEQISTGFSNFLSGGLASFVFWAFAIPADNVKK
jgi:solute carrier family 25 carnitine/acylcarnitine transporter 20/29